MSKRSDGENQYISESNRFDYLVFNVQSGYLVIWVFNAKSGYFGIVYLMPSLVT